MQQTIAQAFELVGRDFYGGNKVKAEFQPAEAGTGILFETVHGVVPADITSAVPSRRSILLRKGNAEIINVEHVLATLFAYGVDNAYIRVRRVPERTLASRSYRAMRAVGLGTRVEVYPNVPGEEIPLCQKLDEVGVEIQDRPRIYGTLDTAVLSTRLSFYPSTNEDLEMKATTNYPEIGRQSVMCAISQENYKTELAGTRRFAQHMMPFM